MSQSDRAIKKLATQLARIDREVKSWRGAQADYTSIEAGTMDINDSDGNLVSRVGFQDDGSGAVRFFDGPVPPVPSGVTASADGPIIQATWDGTFQDGAEATYDLAYLEVAATQVDDASNVSFATITAKEGASASVVADVTGDWVVAVRSVSQAGKKSEFATAGTVEVKVTDLSGAIEDVQQSANGKNQVHYSTEPPTEADAGIVGDTWWVGMDGRPEEVLATNLATNPSFTSLNNQIGGGTMSASSGTAVIVTADWSESGNTALKVTPTASNNTTAVFQMTSEDTATAADAGKTFTISANIHLESEQTGSLWSHPRRIVVRTRYGGYTSWSYAYSSSAPNEPGTHRVSVTFTLQPNTEWWYFMLTNGSSTVPVYWDSIIVEEGSGSGQYFDGDTPSGTSDNDPHYRWTGTPHASTSEQFLPEIGSGTWNITEQYQYTPDGWTQVELSHEVIATVDLGKATVGELDGIRIMAKTISGDLFSGDAFDGIVFRGNTFTTRDGNGEFSDRGLFFQKPDGTSIFRVPTDGTPISMSASDVQIERAQVDELDLNIGRVRSGGLLELSSGVTPPASPPELNAAWRRLLTLPEVDEGISVNGFTAWGDKWVRALNVRGVAEGDRLEIYTPDGEVETSIPLTMNPRNGCTVLGDVCYVLGHQHGRPVDEQRVHGYDLTTGERVTNWVFTRFTASNQKPISIGNDGSNLLVAGVTPTPRLYVMRYDPVTGEQVGSDMVMSPESDYHFTVNGVSATGGKLYVSAQQTVREYVESGGAWSFNGFAWDNPNRDGAGFVFVDGQPRVVDGAGNVYKGSLFAGGTVIQACFTWFDGTHETTASPADTVTVAAREYVKCSLPTRPGLMKRVYSRYGSGDWTREDVAENVTVVDLGFASPNTQPPASNSFPNADPAVFRSTNGNVIIRGDGSGKWGPLTFNPDGTMTSTQIPAWVPVTTFASGFGPQSWGFAPAYRVWPDGKVEWRGIVAGSAMASGQVEPFTIPVEARPPQFVQFAAASTTGANVKRVEFRPPVVTDGGPTNVVRVYHGGVNGSWVSLDGIFYYLT